MSVTIKSGRKEVYFELPKVLSYSNGIKLILHWSYSEESSFNSCNPHNTTPSSSESEIVPISVVGYNDIEWEDAINQHLPTELAVAVIDCIQEQCEDMLKAGMPRQWAEEYYGY